MLILTSLAFWESLEIQWQILSCLNGSLALQPVKVSG